MPKSMLLQAAPCFHIICVNRPALKKLDSIDTPVEVTITIDIQASNHEHGFLLLMVFLKVKKKISISKAQLKYVKSLIPETHDGESKPAVNTMTNLCLSKVTSHNYIIDSGATNFTSSSELLHKISVCHQYHYQVERKQRKMPKDLYF